MPWREGCRAALCMLQSCLHELPQKWRNEGSEKRGAGKLCTEIGRMFGIYRFSPWLESIRSKNQRKVSVHSPHFQKQPRTLWGRSVIGEFRWFLFPNLQDDGFASRVKKDQCDVARRRLGIDRGPLHRFPINCPTSDAIPKSDRP